ncbi:MAG: aspartyl protease family protein [Candidatus Aminicenantes bacterium]|nr:MAG: aspartyl protease family protein [Candidatus Aminicenantes bacterium]
MNRKLSKFLMALFMTTFTIIGNYGQVTTHAQTETKESFGCQIASGRSARPIPVKLVDNVVYLPVRINNSHSFDFILDSGAGNASAVDENIARALKLPLGRKFQSGGAGEKQVDMYLINNLKYELPGLKFTAENAFTVPLDWMSPHWGRRLEGLVGGDLLSCAVTEIDYVERTVCFHDPKTFQYQGKGEAIPLDLKGWPFVEAKIFLIGKQDPINARFMLDTGLRISAFNSPFVKENRLIEQSPQTVKAMTGFGIGGESRGVLGRVRGIQIGSIIIENPIVDFSQDKKGALATDAYSGIIGAEILCRFNVVFDYARKRVFLEKNAHFSQPFEFDMSGIRIISEEENFRRHKVFRLIEDSPAARAGLKEGDEIIKIDGRSSPEFSQEEMKKLLMREGKKVTLTIRRSGKLLNVTFRLERFV